MTPVLVLGTILKWISSCTTSEQLDIADNCIVKLFDEQFNLEEDQNLSFSYELHTAVEQRRADLASAVLKILDDAKKTNHIPDDYIMD